MALRAEAIRGPADTSSPPAAIRRADSSGPEGWQGCLWLVDDFHLLITPVQSLERALQTMKGFLIVRGKSLGLLERSRKRALMIDDCGTWKNIWRFGVMSG